MAFVEKVRKAIKTGQMQPNFSSEDVTAAGIGYPNHNFPNYDKKNLSSLNTKVLVSVKINGKSYCTLGKQVFE